MMVQSSSFSTASLETEICPKTPKGFTRLCIVTFLHSRSLQSAWAENWISWQTELLFHCRRYMCGSFKEIITYSSSEGTFLSDTNGFKYEGGAVGKTNKKNSDWDEPKLHGNKEMVFNYSLFGYWIQYLMVNKFKHSPEDITIFELPFDICRQNWFVQSASLLNTYCPKVTFSFTNIWSQRQ